MGSGFAMATLRHYYPFFRGSTDSSGSYAEVWRWIALGIFILANLFAFYLIGTSSKKKEMAISYCLGLLFGLGLVISGMCRISKI
jgi:uncharacterized membrane protein YedE/YeeE